MKTPRCTLRYSEADQADYARLEGAAFNVGAVTIVTPTCRVTFDLDVGGPPSRRRVTAGLTATRAFRLLDGILTMLSRVKLR